MGASFNGTGTVSIYHSFIKYDSYIFSGRTDYLIAKVLAKDTFFNWNPVPRQPISAQDEVDISRIRNLLACTNLKAPKWVKYPRRFLFVIIFVTINILHAIHIAVRKVHI